MGGRFMKMRMMQAVMNSAATISQSVRERVFMAAMIDDFDGTLQERP